MDYKINQIKGKLDADDPMMLDIDGLFFINLNNNYTVWDYTEFVTHNNIDIDFKVLLRACKRLIENLVVMYELDRSALFFQDEEGRYYARAELLFVILMFADPNLCAYFNNLLGDTMSQGVSFSNAMIYQLAASRLPVQAIKNILKEKDNDNPDTSE